MLDARAKTVRDILHSGDQYLIPFFQRHYSWDAKHWQRILDDVDALGETPPDRLHFLGPLVCAPTVHVPGEVTPYQLIDGQQRLTTLTLMLCALRDLAKKSGQPDLSAEISEDFLLHKRRQGVNRFKVVPRLGDREALLAILEEKDIGQWRDLRVAKCLRFFEKEFAKRTELNAAETIPRLLRDLTARMALVVITVMGENPYEIFESLNSTGLPLEQSDLVRNYIFMEVPLGAQQTFYDEQWRPFEVLFDANGKDPAIRATAFYRDYLLREGTYLAAKDTYVDFKDQSARRGLTPAAQVAELRGYLELELWIQRPAACPDPRVRACLRELSTLDAATANPLVLVLLARLKEGSVSHDAFDVAMRDLSSFVIRRSVVGESTRAYGRWFVDSIRRVGADPVEDLRGFWSERGWPSDREFAQRLLEFPIYRREVAKCRLLLSRLEQSYGHKERVDPSTLTIEHVLPQTLDDGSSGTSWKEVLGPNWFQAQQRWVHTLGNLTLTGYNAEMSNSAFGIKRKALLGSNLILNAYFDSLDRWDPAAIEHRGRELAKQICALWPNPRQDPDVEPAEELPSEAIKSNFDIDQLRSQSLERVSEFLKTEFTREGYARYASLDGNVHVVCLASQPYVDTQGEKYWYGVTPMQIEFLKETPVSHLALCCGSPDRILWMPRSDFLPFIEQMNTTAEKHWHIHIFGGATLRLDQPKSQTRVDVTSYLLPPTPK